MGVVFRWVWDFFCGRKSVGLDCLIACCMSWDLGCEKDGLFAALSVILGGY